MMMRETRGARSRSGDAAGVLSALLFVLALGSAVTQARPQDKLERSEQIDLFDRGRWSWQQPSKIMDALGVKPGMAVADIGAGYGFFTFGLADLVGKEGAVYANEVEAGFLEVIREDCRKKKITNVITVLGEPNDPKLPEGKIDLALMVNVMMYLENPQEFFANLKPCLKPDGIFAIVEWVKEKGFSQGKVKTTDEIRELLAAGGFSVVKVETFLPRQHIFVCRVT